MPSARFGQRSGGKERVYQVVFFVFCTVPMRLLRVARRGLRFLGPSKHQGEPVARYLLALWLVYVRTSAIQQSPTGWKKERPTRKKKKSYRSKNAKITGFRRASCLPKNRLRACVLPSTKNRLPACVFQGKKITTFASGVCVSVFRRVFCLLYTSPSPRD